MSQTVTIIKNAQHGRYEAKKRIPDYMKAQGWRFFSDWVLWKYFLDNTPSPSGVYGRNCPICGEWVGSPVIIGSKIRLLFPYLEIVDRDLIFVNQHPHCRCWLERR